jgi:hypothetical protein
VNLAQLKAAHAAAEDLRLLEEARCNAVDITSRERVAVRFRHDRDSLYDRGDTLFEVDVGELRIWLQGLADDRRARLKAAGVEPS